MAQNLEKLKQMKVAKQNNLYSFLKDYELTRRASNRLKPLLQFKN